jgi:hypothetical protein
MGLVSHHFGHRIIDRDSSSTIYSCPTCGQIINPKKLDKTPKYCYNIEHTMEYPEDITFRKIERKLTIIERQIWALYVIIPFGYIVLPYLNS